MIYVPFDKSSFPEKEMGRGRCLILTALFTKVNLDIDLFRHFQTFMELILSAQFKVMYLEA